MSRRKRPDVRAAVRKAALRRSSGATPATPPNGPSKGGVPGDRLDFLFADAPATSPDASSDAGTARPVGVSGPTNGTQPTGVANPVSLSAANLPAKPQPTAKAKPNAEREREITTGSAPHAMPSGASTPHASPWRTPPPRRHRGDPHDTAASTPGALETLTNGPLARLRLVVTWAAAAPLLGVITTASLAARLYLRWRGPS